MVNLLGRIPCPASELNLNVVLLNGQSFRNLDDGSGRIVGVAKDRIWLLHRVNDNEIEWSILHQFVDGNRANASTSHEQVLKDYFQLDVKLEALYREWSGSDEKFALRLKENGQLLSGIRILEQDPFETVFAFICSANNNISRISKMVNKLAELYGPKATVTLGKSEQSFSAFPELDEFPEDVTEIEKTLRIEGFGYRAGYLAKTVQRLRQLNGRDWLLGLKSKPYPDVAEELIQELSGVGPKVADCICLMSLGKSEVTPVDTHVRQITAQLYRPDLKHKSTSLKQHREIGQFYAGKFGQFAGWAHSVLFTAQLKRQFSDAKPVKSVTKKVKNNQK